MGAHRDAVVVALGIYMADASAVDAGLIMDEQWSVLPPDGLRELVGDATHRHGSALQGLAVSYPAWWEPLRVDRLLREVRVADLVVNRYLTSGEAAVRWWRHVVGGNTLSAGALLVHDVMQHPSHVTLIRFDLLDIVTVASQRVEPQDVKCVGRRLVESARLSMADLAPTLVVGTAGSEYEHAVALGTALAATL